MEKAYDLKALGEKIKEEAKKEGLDLAEQAVEKLAKAVYNGTKSWAKESAALSKDGLLGKVDDYVAPFYDQLDSVVNPQIDKIDLDGDGD